MADTRPRLEAARVAEAVVSALAKQLNLPGETVRQRRDASLEDLGLDSHGLLRVLLAIEQDLALGASLELADEALDTPATLIAGVAAVVGAA